MVVRQEFVLRVPEGLDLTRAAPLLCAGTYSPLRTWGVGPGSRVGVIGLGGLGHMAVKLAAGLGAHVTVMSRTAEKRADALALGADQLLVSADEDAMAKAQSSFDLIIDTIPAKHDISPYMPLLDVDGTLVIVGHLGNLNEPFTGPLIMGWRRVAGSPIGGIAETQDAARLRAGLFGCCRAGDVFPTGRPASRLRVGAERRCRRVFGSFLVASFSPADPIAELRPVHVVRAASVLHRLYPLA